MSEGATYLGFMDESHHTASNQFTACGLTVIDAKHAKTLHEKIKIIRANHGFSNEVSLKWTPPTGWKTPEERQPHTQAKKEVLDLLATGGVHFFGYLHFNPKKELNDSTRNSQFGFNTLLGGFDKWLGTNGSVGHVTFDRMEWSGAFEYLKEKNCSGLVFSSQERTSELSNILSYSMGAARTSELCCLNDVITGALAYVANISHAIDTRAKIVKSMSRGLLRGEDFRFAETSFFMRPKEKSKLSAERRAEYDTIRAFLNNALVWRRQGICDAIPSIKAHHCKADGPKRKVRGITHLTGKIK